MSLFTSKSFRKWNREIPKACTQMVCFILRTNSLVCGAELKVWIHDIRSRWSQVGLAALLSTCSAPTYCKSFSVSSASSQVMTWRLLTNYKSLGLSQSALITLSNPFLFIYSLSHRLILVSLAHLDSRSTKKPRDSVVKWLSYMRVEKVGEGKLRDWRG